MLEREKVVFNDYIEVITDDGTWERKSLQLSPHFDEDISEADSDVATEFYTAQRNCAKAVLDAYKDGKLDNAGYTGLSQSTKEDVMLVDLALRAKDLPDDVWETLSKYGQQCGCLYSGCLPVAHMRMHTYRGSNECVGSSWETILCERLGTRTVSTIADIRKKFGTYAAALTVLWTITPAVDGEVDKIEGLTSYIKKNIA